MEAQEDKNKQNDTKGQIKVLEQEMMTAFQEASYESVKTLAGQIKAIDPKNHMAEKLVKKVEKVNAKEDKKAKLEKAKEYKVMFKKLYKDRNLEKLMALAREFKDSAPESKLADKWLLRAEKLKERLGGKKEEIKKDAKTDEEKKPGLFAKLFKKSEKPVEAEKKGGIMQMMAEKAKAEPAKIEVKEEKVEVKKEEKKEEPVKIEVKPEPIKPAISIPVEPPVAKPTPAPAAPAVPAIAPLKKEITPKEKAPAEANGNIFTKMFGKKEEETQKKSIIDTIVAKTDKKEEKKAPEKEAKAPAEKKDGAGLLTFSKVFMNFAIIFIVFSAAFIYVEWIDKENTILSLAGISENTGGRLHSASEEASTLRRQEAILSKDIALYKGGYDDRALTIVESIIDERINWPDIFVKINEVTNSVYELNDFFKYIEYNNYSFDAENGTIRVTGTLSDPLGRNLTKLVELEEAFKYYPKDRNNPDDTTEPYFIGFREFTSFSKTLDPATGRYSSSFQLSFALNE